jgi:hypothetical protein
VPTVTPDQGLTLPIQADAANEQTAFANYNGANGVESRLVKRYINLADRTARNPTPTAGEISFLTTPGQHYRYNGTAVAWWELYPVTAYKLTETQVVNNSTVFVNDSHLALGLQANAIYGLSGWLAWDSGTTGDIKFDWTGPAGFTMPVWAGARIDSAVAGAVGNMTGLVSAAATTVVVAAGAGIGTFSSLNLGGAVITTGTAGTLQLRWAQNAAEAVNTRLKAGSWVGITRVG